MGSRERTQQVLAEVHTQQCRCCQVSQHSLPPHCHPKSPFIALSDFSTFIGILCWGCLCVCVCVVNFQEVIIFS